MFHNNFDGIIEPIRLFTLDGHRNKKMEQQILSFNSFIRRFNGCDLVLISYTSKSLQKQ